MKGKDVGLSTQAVLDEMGKPSGLLEEMGKGPLKGVRFAVKPDLSEPRTLTSARTGDV